MIQNTEAAGTAAQSSDAVAGGVWSGVGSFMLTVQVMTGFVNLGLVVVNLVLAVFGLFLMWPRIKKRWREIRDGE